MRALLALRAQIHVIMSPVGPYYPAGLVPIDLFLDEENVRAWPGGTGQYKIGGNYAPTIQPQVQAMRAHKCQQVLYAIPGAATPNIPPHPPLPSTPPTQPPPSAASSAPEPGVGAAAGGALGGAEDGDVFVSESGAMNVFFLLRTEDGDEELVTQPLDGTILPGVTRDTVLALCRSWAEGKGKGKGCAWGMEGQPGEWEGRLRVTERVLSVRELAAAGAEGRVLEMFGTGTAALIQPIRRLVRARGAPPIHTQRGPVLSARIHDVVTDIQYGLLPDHPWSYKV